MDAFPENHDLGPEGSEDASKSNITTPEQDEKKAEKIQQLIDQIVTDKLKPIEGQLEQLPVLIHDTVVQVFNEVSASQPQQQGPQQPQQGPQQNNNMMQAIAALGPLLKSEQSAPVNDPMLDMIKGAFSKMIQAKVDETIMGTYGVRMQPPAGLIEPTKVKSQGSDLVE